MNDNQPNPEIVELCLELQDSTSDIEWESDQQFIDALCLYFIQNMSFYHNKRDLDGLKKRLADINNHIINQVILRDIDSITLN